MPKIAPYRFKVVDFVFRNLGENRLRTYLTISGIAVCVILFIFFNAVGEGVNEHIADRQSETHITRYSEMAEIMQSWLNVINIILIIILAVAVANTMLIAVSERQRILGTLKALGFTRRQLRTLIMLEALAITSFAFFIGSIIGISAAVLCDYLFWQFSPSGGELGFFAPAEITTGSIIGAALLSIIAGTLAALYPAVQASNLEPAEALRYE